MTGTDGYCAWAAAWRLATGTIFFVATELDAQLPTKADSTQLLAVTRSVLNAQSKILVNGNVEAALTGPGGVAVGHRTGARKGLERAAGLRQALVSAGHQYTSFEDAVTIVGLNVANDTAVLTVRYRVRFAHRTADPMSPKFVGETFNHDLVFRRDSAGWMLLSEREWTMSEHRHKEQPGVALPSVTVAPARAIRGQGGPPFNRNRSPASGGMAAIGNFASFDAVPRWRAGTFKPQLAVDYARRWSNAYGGGYNPAYPDFGPSWKNLWGAGNDCTNFASQIVAAGGWMQVMHPSLVTTDNHYWWMSDESSYSHSWSISHNFHWWMYYSGRGEFWHSFDAAGPGDVVQFDWGPNDQRIDHTMVMTSTDMYDWYLTGHSTDLEDEPLAAIGSRNPGMALYLFLMFYNY
jgi:hypothetical protein